MGNARGSPSVFSQPYMENNLRKKYNFIGPNTGEYTGRTPGEHTRRTPSISLYIYIYI
jgi:hypothetical protein